MAAMVVVVVAETAAAATAAISAATTTTIAAVATVATSASRLQSGESGEGQRSSQQTKDAAASGGVVGVGHLLRELLQIHFETSSLIAWEAHRLQVRRHSRYWQFHVPGRGAVLICR